MELKYLIILLCIELSLAHRYYNHRLHSDSYSDEDYSEELPEPPKPIRKHNIQVNKNPVREKPKAFVKNNPENRNQNKIISQYEVTENVIDIPDDRAVNGRVDTRFILNKPINQVVNKNPTKISIVDENKGTSNHENELKRLEKEYNSIVQMLESNRKQDTHAKMINYTVISNKMSNFWNDVKITFNKMADDIENGAKGVSNEIDKAQSFLYKLHESGKNVVTKVGTFFGG